MTPPADPERYKNHRFPGEIISHGVWLYYRFPLSYRDVQELLFERGSDVTPPRRALGHCLSLQALHWSLMTPQEARSSVFCASRQTPRPAGA